VKRSGIACLTLFFMLIFTIVYKKAVIMLLSGAFLNLIKPSMKNLFFCILTCCIAITLSAQNGSGGNSVSAVSSFIDIQKTLQRPSDALSKNEAALKKQFEDKKLVWPAKYVYIRSFKYDSQLEIWVKNDKKDPYRLFKTYKVCALAGTLGPKRMGGDYQVPEGFYYINEFNPKSNYHLSLGLNYPNISDRILSDATNPGGDIYIHGSCVTVGCIPLTDPMIEEVYIITAHAKDQGQDFIPVHIFPIRYNVKRSIDFLGKLTKDDEQLKDFSLRLEDAFNYFEKHKQVPVVAVSDKGAYYVNDAPDKKKMYASATESIKPIPKRKNVQHRTREITGLVESVTQWPKYQSGGDDLLKYLDKLGKEMRDYLPKGTRKAFVQLEFIVDKDGVPVNFKVIRGGVNEDFNDELISKIEATMATWQPALLSDKPVPKKMIQTVTIEIPEPMEM
jgi:murein L,D-transpeptidase YafK